MPRNGGEKMELSIPSRTDYLSIVNKVTEEVADHLGMNEDDKNSVATAVIEAATNAIQHGNKGDQTKTVTIRFIVSPKSLEVVVKDEGAGFDPASIPSPLTPENFLRERGRGIFIIRSFMDDVRFENKGRKGMTVRLIKHRAPVPT